MITQFEKQWQKFTAIIESLLIKQTDVDAINTDIINNRIIDFFDLWNYDSVSEGVWLKEAREIDASTVDKLIETAKKISIKKIESNKPSMFVYYILIGTIGMLFGMVAYNFEIATWKIITAAFAGLIIGSTFILPVGQQKLKAYNKDLIAKYMKQIEPHKQVLLNIINEI